MAWHSVKYDEVYLHDYAAPHGGREQPLLTATTTAASLGRPHLNGTGFPVLTMGSTTVRPLASFTVGMQRRGHCSQLLVEADALPVWAYDMRSDGMCLAVVGDLQRADLSKRLLVLNDEGHCIAEMTPVGTQGWYFNCDHP